MSSSEYLAIVEACCIAGDVQLDGGSVDVSVSSDLFSIEGVEREGEKLVVHHVLSSRSVGLDGWPLDM